MTEHEAFYEMAADMRKLVSRWRLDANVRSIGSKVGFTVAAKELEQLLERYGQNEAWEGE